MIFCGVFCSRLNEPTVACSASRANDLAHCQAWVHYKVFSLLIGGLWKSPNWISPQLACQDERGPVGCLRCLFYTVYTRYKGQSTKRMKRRSVSVLSVFLRDIHLISRLNRSGREGHLRQDSETVHSRLWGNFLVMQSSCSTVRDISRNEFLEGISSALAQGFALIKSWND